MRQIDLAVEAGVSQSEISTLERDLRNPTVETLRKIVEALGYRLDIRFVSNQICQVTSRNTDRLWCDVREGKWRCERTEPHGLEGSHFISAHTREHDLAGDGYSCESIDIWIGSNPDHDHMTAWNGE